MQTDNFVVDLAGVATPAQDYAEFCSECAPGPLGVTWTPMMLEFVELYNLIVNPATGQPEQDPTATIMVDTISVSRAGMISLELLTGETLVLCSGGVAGYSF